MSSDAQLKGDSQRRQLETTDKYIADNGLELVERLSDLGVSAFRGANVEYGALGKFLQAVREGKVESGSYLIVEALGRAPTIRCNSSSGCLLPSCWQANKFGSYSKASTIGIVLGRRETMIRKQVT